LLLALQRSGINLLPEDGTEFICEGKGRHEFKDKSVEQHAYADIAEVCMQSDLAFSKHNKTLGKGRACFRLRSNTNYSVHSPFDVDNDLDYKTVLCYGEKTTFVPGSDVKPNFLPLETHMNLVLCLAQNPDNEEILGQYRSRMSTALIKERVKRLLTALRPLSFH